MENSLVYKLLWWCGHTGLSGNATKLLNSSTRTCYGVENAMKLYKESTITLIEELSSVGAKQEERVVEKLMR